MITAALAMTTMLLCDVTHQGRDAPQGTAAPAATGKERLLAARKKELGKLKKRVVELEKAKSDRIKWCRAHYADMHGEMSYPRWMEDCVWESSTLKEDLAEIELLTRYYTSIDGAYLDKLESRFGSGFLDRMADFDVLASNPIRKPVDGQLSIRTPVEMFADQLERAIDLPPRPGLTGTVQLSPQSIDGLGAGLPPALPLRDANVLMPEGFVAYLRSIDGRDGVWVSYPSGSGPSAQPTPFPLPSPSSLPPPAPLLPLLPTDAGTVRMTAPNGDIVLGRQRSTLPPQAEDTSARSGLDQIPNQAADVKAALTRLLQSGAYDPGDRTFCNQLLSDFARRHFDYDGFIDKPKDQPKLANKIVDDIIADPNWTVLQVRGNDSATWQADLQATLDESVNQANRGRLVVAGWRNDLGHGHVAVILPGVLPSQAGETSRRRGLALPRTAQAGRGLWPIASWDPGDLLSASFPLNAVGGEEGRDPWTVVLAVLNGHTFQEKPNHRAVK